MSPAEKVKAVLASVVWLKGLGAQLTVLPCSEAEVAEAAKEFGSEVREQISTSHFDPVPCLIYATSKTVEGVYVTFQGHRVATPDDVMRLAVSHYPGGQPVPTDAALALLKREVLP